MAFGEVMAAIVDDGVSNSVSIIHSIWTFTILNHPYRSHSRMIRPLTTVVTNNTTLTSYCVQRSVVDVEVSVNY